MSPTITMSDGTELSPADLDDTLLRALREPMFVCVDHPDARGDHEVVVYNEDREYTVNVDVGHCTCPAQQYHHGPGEPCKHRVRAQLALGEREIPEWVQMEAVDISLRKRLEEMEGQR